MSLIAGPTGRAVAAWAAAAERAGRRCVVHEPREGSDVAGAWLEQTAGGMGLEEAALAGLGRAASETRLFLVTASPSELEAFLDRAAPREGPRRRILRALAAGRRLGRATLSDAPSVDDVREVAAMLAPPALPAFIVRSNDSSDRELERTAAALVELAVATPELPLAIAAPGDTVTWLCDRLGSDRVGAVLREGRIALQGDPRPSRPGGVDAAQRGAGAAPSAAEASSRYRGELSRALASGDEDGARSAAERMLYLALESHPDTAGLFELNGRLPFRFGPANAEVDLLARSIGFALEIDGPHHFGDAGAYRRDRRKDLLLQEHGLTVARVLASDVADDLDTVLDLVLAAVARRRATCTSTRHDLIA